MSGELICASDEAEVHVYLQHGRIAWATDSTHPFAFTRRLREITAIENDTLREILEACKRERRPLGETLVSWGAASREEVREALRHQVSLALEVILTSSSGVTQSIFLDRTRQFAQYDASLTFDLADLRRASSVLPSSQQKRTRSGLARDLMQRFGALWVAVFDRMSLVEGEPDTSDLPPLDVPIQAVLGGSSIVIVRELSGTLAGASLGGGGTVWCELTRGAPLGPVFAALLGLIANRSHPALTTFVEPRRAKRNAHRAPHLPRGGPRDPRGGGDRGGPPQRADRCRRVRPGRTTRARARTDAFAHDTEPRTTRSLIDKITARSAEGLHRGGARLVLRHLHARRFAASVDLDGSSRRSRPRVGPVDSARPPTSSLVLRGGSRSSRSSHAHVLATSSLLRGLLFRGDSWWANRDLNPKPMD